MQLYNHPFVVKIITLIKDKIDEDEFLCLTVMMFNRLLPNTEVLKVKLINCTNFPDDSIDSHNRTRRPQKSSMAVYGIEQRAAFVGWSTRVRTSDTKAVWILLVTNVFGSQTPRTFSTDGRPTCVIDVGRPFGDFRSLDVYRSVAHCIRVPWFSVDFPVNRPCDCTFRSVARSDPFGRTSSETVPDIHNRSASCRLWKLKL